jgi:hypothetical protein
MSFAREFNFDNTISILIELRANVDRGAFGSIKIPDSDRRRVCP